MAEISVIIPVYNKIKYLTDLFSHLKQQTYYDFECIIVDDGSTDGSSEKLEELSKNDERFKIVHIKNAGVSNARNTGLHMAKGKYITFIDSDDTFEKDYLLNLYDKINYTKSDIVISGLKKVWGNYERVEIIKPPIIGLYNIDDIIDEFAQIQMSTGLYGYCCGKIFNKCKFDNIYFDKNLALAEDFDFYLKLYERISTIYLDDKCYYNYLQNTENSSIKNDDYSIDYFSQLKINLRYRDFIKKKNAFNGNNKTIINKLISNYVYFTIFYSRIENFNDIYKKVYKLINENDITLCASNLMQKWFFFNLIKNNYFLLKVTLITYRMIRKIVKRR